jgi:hypothetical protein
MLKDVILCPPDVVQGRAPRTAANDERALGNFYASAFSFIETITSSKQWRRLERKHAGGIIHRSLSFAWFIPFVRPRLTHRQRLKS